MIQNPNTPPSPETKSSLEALFEQSYYLDTGVDSEVTLSLDRQTIIKKWRPVSQDALADKSDGLGNDYDRVARRINQYQVRTQEAISNPIKGVLIRNKKVEVKVLPINKVERGECNTFSQSTYVEGLTVDDILEELTPEDYQTLSTVFLKTIPSILGLPKDQLGSKNVKFIEKGETISLIITDLYSSVAAGMNNQKHIT
jgi:hypothetical protein